MWKGIRIVRGRLILTNNAVIQDADYAVNIQGARAVALISQNKFDRNYVGIYVPPLTGSAARLAQGANVFNNKFLCTAALAPRHTSQSPVPAQENWGWAGALIYDQPGITFSGSATEFKGLRSGIIALRSNVTVNSVTFKDLLDTPGKDPIYGSFLYNNAVYGDRCPLVTVLNCKMENCRGGIRVNSSGLRAENNPKIYITAPDNSNIALPIAISAANSSMRTMIIRNNADIRTTAYGIGVSIGDMEPIITNNTILLRANARNAIELNQCRMVQCNDNTIKTEGGSVSDRRTAIELFTVQNCDFFDNFIAGTDYGIREKWGFLNRFIGNRVDATVVPGGTTPKRGFQIDQSSGEYFCDNTTNTSIVGFDFFGQCASSDFFRCSKMLNSSTGLRLNADNDPSSPWFTTIGVQTHTGNMWTNTNAFNAANAKNPIEQSQIIMRAPLPSWSTGYNGPPPAPQWFVANNLGVADCENCGSRRVPDRLDSPPLAAGIAERTAATGGYDNPVTNWVAGQQLYERLYNQPANIEKAPEFSAFMEEHQNGLMGVMYQIRQQMYRKSATWVTRYSIMHELSRGLSAKLEEARLLQEAEADEQTIQLKFAEAGWYAVQAEQLMAQITADFEESASGLLAQNAALPTPNAAVAHEKALHELLLANGYWNWSPQQPLSEASMAGLKSLADQCPFTHGLSVYEARAWYAFFHPEAFWLPTEGCGYQERPLSGQSLGAESVRLSVFPNPVRDLLTVQLSAGLQTQSHFELRDLSGKLWVVKTVVSGEHSFDISTQEIPAGLYVYTLRTAKDIPQSGKIVIIH
jgi:hypothetical protein